MEFEDVNRVDNWKKALMIGSFGAAAWLLITGKRPAGFALAGIGLAVLATEHPEKFEEIWNRAPEYLDKGHRIVNQVSGLVEKIGEQAGRFQQRRAGRAGSDYLT